MIIDDIFKQSVFTGSGRCSTFGGRIDTGVMPDEGLALANHLDLIRNDSPLNGLWLPQAPEGTIGLARRLNEFAFYCACRWEYLLTSINVLRDSYVVVIHRDAQRVCLVKPVDWGPNVKTGRDIDLSPGAAYFLGVSTDSIVDFALWSPLVS